MFKSYKKCKKRRENKINRSLVSEVAHYMWTRLALLFLYRQIKIFDRDYYDVLILL